MPLWNIPGPFLFHGGCALAKSLVYRGQWLGDEDQATTSMHLDCRSKRCRQDDVRTPEIAAIAAARMALGELDRLVADRADFAFETTLSGRTYVHRLKSWKRAGYRIDIVYLKLSSSRLALRRVAARVRQGGHWPASITSSVRQVQLSPVRPQCSTG
jgi:predicted ABC-type ATPase